LKKSFLNPDPKVRYYAVRIAEARKEKSLYTALNELLQDSDGNVRKAAKSALKALEKD
jgi:HEAT repeat protein